MDDLVNKLCAIMKPIIVMKAGKANNSVVSFELLNVNNKQNHKQKRTYVTNKILQNKDALDLEE